MLFSAMTSGIHPLNPPTLSPLAELQATFAMTWLPRKEKSECKGLIDYHSFICHLHIVP